MCYSGIRRLALIVNLRSAAELSRQEVRGYDYTRFRPGFGRAGRPYSENKKGPDELCRNRSAIRYGYCACITETKRLGKSRKQRDSRRAAIERRIVSAQLRSTNPFDPRLPPNSHVCDPIALNHGH